MVKKCYKCKIEKDINNFYLLQNKRYRHSYCKECLKSYVRFNPNGRKSRAEYREENNEKIKKYRECDKIYQRKKREENIGFKTIEARIFRKENPEKVKSYGILHRALKKETIIRSSCFCGRKDVHGHHPDYSKPLEVIWLCPVHHKLQYH